MQGRPFSHGATSLFCTLELLNRKVTHANPARILCVRASGVLLHAPDTPCEVQDFAMHNGAMPHLIAFTNASRHTWPRPTRLLGVVVGAADLNLSTHRGQYHNLDSVIVVELISNLGGIFTAQTLCQKWTILQLAGTSKTFWWFEFKIGVNFLTMQTHARGSSL